MSRKTAVALSLMILLSVLIFPALTFAQGGAPGAIAGVVRDTTGAVIPGVTVEASSPALIEKVRSVVTDDQGQYRIVDLRPGVYALTFSLPGFNTVRREGIQMTAAFTANVNADMRVGAVEETVTVSGQSPVVDIQNVAQQRSITADVIDALPTGRTFYGLAQTIPGVTRSDITDVGGTAGERVQTMAIHGSRAGSMPLIYDGMRYNNMNLAGISFLMINTGNVEELSIEVAGTSAEHQVSGVFVNVIPKDGGNTFRGSFFTNYTSRGLEMDNWTGNDELRSRGIVSVDGRDPVNTTDKVWDVNPAFGGAIKQDKLWFYSAVRYWGNSINVANTWFNQTPNTPFHRPDFSKPAKTGDSLNASENLRLTWQAASKHKVSAYYDLQQRKYDYRNVSPTTAPEAAEFFRNPNYLAQVKWTYAVSNRLLIQGGASAANGVLRNDHSPLQAEDTMAIQELSTGLRYAGMSNRAPNWVPSRTFNYRFDVSYLTGSHATKFGLQLIDGSKTSNFTIPRGMTAQFLNGVPRTLTVYATPYFLESNAKPSPSLFAQDQWTMRRVTLNYGLRFDYFNAYVPEQHVPEALFVPARDFPAVHNLPNWKDLSPRVGVSYDLFGSGRTAVKVSLGRYVQAQVLELADANNPITTSVTSVNRTWTDLNGNFIPECDFRSLDANGECLAVNNRNFGRNNPLATRYDPDVLSGFGKRPYDWEVMTGIQHEILPGTALNVAYYRHWFGNFTVTQNQAVTSADFDSYCITAPVDTRLPGGGGNQICGLYDVKLARFGSISNLVTFAKNFGEQKEIYNGVDITLNARLPRGAFLQGGVTIGRLETDNCFTASSPNLSSAGQLPGTPRSTPYCNVKPPLAAGTQIKFSGTYHLPWDLSASAVYQNMAGPEVTAAYAMTNAQIAPALGRNLSTATVTVALIPPATMYERRINQLDMRLARPFRVGRASIQVLMDVYNVLNWASVLGQNLQYGPQWRNVQNVGWTSFGFLPGRMFKFGTKVDF